MKKNITMLIFLCILFIKNTQAQTIVSGGIYSNTTWTLANSPYIATDTIVVFPGVILTIEPGVIVKFDANVRLEVRDATLIANGTSSQPIVFTSNAILPAMGDWLGIFLNTDFTPPPSEFNFCTFEYSERGLHAGMAWILYSYVKNSKFLFNEEGLSAAGLVDSCFFYNNTYGIRWTAFTVSNSVFKYNQYAIGDYVSSVQINNCVVDSNSIMGLSIAQNTNIQGCSIRNNGTGIQVSGGGVQSNIHHNIIENNTIGIKLYGWYENIYCNKICNNFSYNLEYGVTFSDNTSIPNNYWCTSDAALVANGIYDGYDNTNLGLVYFMPVDTQSCFISTAISEPLADADEATNVKFFPNPFISFILMESNVDLQNATMQVYDLSGRQILKVNNINGKSFNFSMDLEKGFYIVKIINNNKIIATEKIFSMD